MAASAKVDAPAAETKVDVVRVDALAAEVRVDAISRVRSPRR